LKKERDATPIHSAPPKPERKRQSKNIDRKNHQKDAITRPDDYKLI
jgi:hypothetical protein